MKYAYLIFALLALSTSCEIRTTNFDPDEQLVSEDEFAQIAVWDQLQTDRITNAEYERLNAKDFVGAKYDYRQTTQGTWVIEGSVTNNATEVHFENIQLILNYYDESNTIVGSETYLLQGSLAPGDQSGFYFKSDNYKDASTMDVTIVNIKAVS